jgi:NitT/TauT family transport system permease protein
MGSGVATMEPMKLPSIQYRILLTRLTLIGLFLGLWEVGAVTGKLEPYFFSRPTSILMDLGRMVLQGRIFYHAWITLQEALLGFFLGSACGIVMGVGLAASPFWARVLDPIIMAMYGIPRIALAPLFILWFGLGVASKVVFSFVLVFFLVFFNTLAGLKSVQREMVDAVRVMGASKSQILRIVIFPAISPWLLASLKSGVGLSLLGAIVGEYVGGNAGLGWVINSAAGLFETTRVFSALTALALLVLAMNAVLNAVERRALRWRAQTDLM